LISLGESMKRAVLKYELSGICEIDVKKAIKYWNLLCRVSRWKDEFYLCTFTPKGARKLKIRISEKDANCLIDELGLFEIQSNLFNSGKTYIST